MYNNNGLESLKNKSIFIIWGMFVFQILNVFLFFIFGFDLFKSGKTGNEIETAFNNVFTVFFIFPLIAGTSFIIPIITYVVSLEGERRLLKHEKIEGMVAIMNFVFYGLLLFFNCLFPSDNKFVKFIFIIRYYNDNRRIQLY